MEIDELILEYEIKLAADNAKLNEISDAISKLNIFDDKPLTHLYQISKKNCKLFAICFTFLLKYDFA